LNETNLAQSENPGPRALASFSVDHFCDLIILAFSPYPYPLSLVDINTIKISYINMITKCETGFYGLLLYCNIAT